jgi:hypothetical protein
MTKNHPPRKNAPKNYAIKSHGVGEADLTASKAAVEPEAASPPRQMAPHPALIGLAHVLGQQAAKFVRKHRYEGLGRIELIRLQEEARAKSINSNILSIKSSNTS